MERYYTAEFLFRIPGDNKIIRKAIHEIIVNNKHLNEIGELKCHDVASILKNLLRHLDEPLIPKMYYDEIIHSEEDKYQELWLKIIPSLSKPNHSLLLILFNFYHNLSLKFNYNKMDSSSIASIITMGGYVCRSDNRSEEMLNFYQFAKFTTCFINNYDEIKTA